MKMLKRVFKCYGRVVNVIFQSFLIAFLLLNSLGYAFSDSYLLLDYCNFMSQETGMTTLETYFQFDNSVLQFVKKDENFVSETEITSVLYDDDGNYITELALEKTIYEYDYHRTLDYNERNIVQFNFLLKPGKYLLTTILSDKNTNYSYRLEKEIKIVQVKQNQLSLSDIQVASSIENTEETSIMVKNGKKIVSNPSRCFGYNYSRAYFYFEVYDLTYSLENISNLFSFSYKITDKKNKVVADFSRAYAKPYNDTAISFYVPTSNLEAGEYDVEVTVRDEDAHNIAKKHTSFYIQRSPIDLKFVDYDKVLNMLTVIAGKNEIRDLKKVVKDQRQQALLTFWKSKDPTPSTIENEFMQEFFRRIAYANRKYSSLGIEGWKTDRGKTYIRFGAPDRIDQSLQRNDWSQYEVWEYFKWQKRFIFLDRHGFGDYRIVSHFIP